MRSGDHIANNALVTEMDTIEGSNCYPGITGVKVIQRGEMLHGSFNQLGEEHLFGLPLLGFGVEYE